MTLTIQTKVTSASTDSLKSRSRLTISPCLADIGVLHAIVTAAQEQIEAAPANKPLLPVAALFKAYDQVLPKHGIDPESDQHLSAFVFRVGGESGGGTLVDKFQAILTRMGIVLEFDENTTASLGPSPSPVPSGSPSTRSISPTPPQLQQIEKIPSLISHDYTPTRGSIQGPPEQHDWHSLLENDAVSFRSSPGPRNPLLSTQRATLSSVMNRWRNAAAQAQRKQGSAALASSLRKSTLAADASLQLPEEEQLGPRRNSQLAEHQIRDFQAPREPDGASKADNDGPVPRPSLLSSVDEWRFSLAQPPISENADAPSSASGHGQLQGSLMRPSRLHEVRETTYAEPRANSSHGHLPPAPRLEPHVAPRKLEAPKSMPRPEETTLASTHEQASTLQAVASQAADASQTEGERLMQRAARAREIYLASQVFNHWADKTARRLEREAVARRHMIRFRCFRGWGEIPSTRAPVAENLRAATAAQKLKRAVAEHEEQLRLVASTAAQAYQLKTIQKALNRWTYRSLEQRFQWMAAVQTRRKALSKWLMCAYERAEVISSVQFHRRQGNEAKSLIRWLAQAERGASCQSSASKTGTSYQSRRSLGHWGDCAEAGRIAQGYRQWHQTLQAGYAFDVWNLQARADAFMAQCRYLKTSRLFEYWFEQSEVHRQSHIEALEMSRRGAKIRTLRHVDQLDLDTQALRRLEYRACLYIRANRLMSIFDSAIKRRKTEEKEALKRYLMMRYQQVSKDRKKRNFFVAMDHWKGLVDTGQEMSAMAEALRSERDEASLASSITTWSSQALEDQRRHRKAQLYRGQSWLDMWSSASAEGQAQITDAISLWATGNYRQYQKAWSISTLQHSSQHHMASALSQRHARDRCSRAFQQWKQRSNKSKNVTFDNLETGSGRPSRFASGGILRKSWRSSTAKSSTAKRQPFGRREDTPSHTLGPVDTPTRWTGQPFPVGSVMSTSRMPALQEADEQGTPLSVAGDDIPSPTKPRVPRGSLSLPSTTPRAPVPAHLDRAFRSRISRSHASSPDRTEGPGSPRDQAEYETAQSPSQGKRAKPPRDFSKSVAADRMSTGNTLFTSAAKSRSVGWQPQRQYATSQRALFSRSAGRPGNSNESRIARDTSYAESRGATPQPVDDPHTS